MSANYSHFFQSLHDEKQPTGYLGRGTHYSVLRGVVWTDPLGKPLNEAKFMDFSIVWDEDHDDRVIQVIEKLYFRNLLSPVLFIGERKGYLSIVLDKSVYQSMQKAGNLANYAGAVREIAESLEDSWDSQINFLGESHQSIISASDENVLLYLENIKMLWQLGQKKIN